MYAALGLMACEHHPPVVSDTHTAQDTEVFVYDSDVADGVSDTQDIHVQTDLSPDLPDDQVSILDDGPSLDLEEDTECESVPWEDPVGPDGFDDHCVGGFQCADTLKAYGDTGELPLQVKFVLTEFDTSEGGGAFFLSNEFYHLHDEFYWFRLINGVPFENFDVEPEDGFSFSFIAEIYAAFENADTLPLDLIFNGDRLYSPHFYAKGLEWGENPQRYFGLGSLLYYPANTDRVIPEPLWLFELEYVDHKITEAQVTTFFERLAQRLPTEVGEALRWLVRSPAQETLGGDIASGSGPYQNRIVTYADLVVSGDVIPYNPGIAAGLVRRFDKGSLGGASVSPLDIVVLEEVPDYLPPVAGIVTAVPQTPLAHLNLLAKSRGTPNAHVAGIFEDEGIFNWDKWNTPVIIKITNETVHWKSISNTDYQHYLTLIAPPNLTIAVVDVNTLSYLLPLKDISLEEHKSLVPIVGGKSAGMIAFSAVADMETPAHPLAISIRAYAEHLAPMAAQILEMLDHPTFQADGRARFAVLEGAKSFLEEHQGDLAALDWYYETFLPVNGPGTPLGNLLMGGGLKEIIRDKPLSESLTNMLEEVQGHFDMLSPLQGLRFRSSSTAEDIQGFNGAGLYDSNTGFTAPTLQEDDTLHDHDLAWALKKTWASYWCFEAFEERRQAAVDHQSGHMGVLVHPRFDDPLEASNGVITFYLKADEDTLTHTMVVNSQAGALSVTNPEVGSNALPEIVSVEATGSEEPVITQIQASTEVPPGSPVLDTELLQIVFDQIGQLATLWLANSNSTLSAPQKSTTLILDLEFKVMMAGWPMWNTGEIMPERFIYKQVRTLDNPITGNSAVNTLPIPQDVLTRVQKVSQWICSTPSFILEAFEVYTDPSKPWGDEYALTPLVPMVRVTVIPALPTLGLQSLQEIEADHTQMVSAELLTMGDDTYQIVIETDNTAPFSMLSIAPDGGWSLSTPMASIDGMSGTCEVTSIHTGPGEFLEQLLATTP